jgi:hypothetical protein
VERSSAADHRDRVAAPALIDQQGVQLVNTVHTNEV